MKYLLYLAFDKHLLIFRTVPYTGVACLLHESLPFLVLVYHWNFEQNIFLYNIYNQLISGDNQAKNKFVVNLFNLSRLCLNSAIPTITRDTYRCICTTWPWKFCRGKTQPGDEFTGKGSIFCRYMSSSHHLYAYKNMSNSYVKCVCIMISWHKILAYK